MEKDRLHDCYIWHIITLAKMKYKLKQLKGGKQYKYYKINLESTEYSTSTNITKKPSASSSNWWWLRSPCYGYSDGFCGVLSSGNCGIDAASSSGGVVPGFAI